MKHIFLLICLLGTYAYGQDHNFSEKDLSISRWIDGTLMTPASGSEKLAIIIGGSGPIDRDGNQNFLKTNNLKKLASQLAQNGIATFRYDKRIVKQIKNNALDTNIMFDDFITDAIGVVNHFHENKKFKNIYIIGHSQGSLIGMLSGKAHVDGIVSLAGAGQSIDAVIMEQIEKTAPMFSQDTKRVLDLLKSGNTTTDYPPALSSLFDISIQPFMASWMKYDPAIVIKDLQIPVLIINGSKDLQVEIEEAKRLHASYENSELKLVDNMNHVLYLIEGDSQENAKSYNDSNKKISEELVKLIVEFINNH